ncbi:MAG: hypothetical protein A2X59_05790 [Nitrospirae bacterium GWC2_42_7]|nr:MAG: hypothetical protein A2X59_05790 [Nitrospirae bacterium GWC2_42_7]
MNILFSGKLKPEFPVFIKRLDKISYVHTGSERPEKGLVRFCFFGSFIFDACSLIAYITAGIAALLAETAIRT